MKLKKRKQPFQPPVPASEDLPIFPLPGMKIPPMPERIEEPVLPEMPEMGQKMQKPVAKKAEMPKTSPPLFIKVTKYRDILQHINNLKSYILGLRDTMDALREIQSELNKAIGLSNRTLDHINSMVGAIDSRMTAIGEPEEMLDMPGQAGPPADIEAYIKDLYNHMEKIKSELKTISPE
jgi:hypothetical protein